MGKLISKCDIVTSEMVKIVFKTERDGLCIVANADDIGC